MKITIDVEVIDQALGDICGAKLCEINSMSSRQEMLRLMDNAITALRQAKEQAQQAEPVRLECVVCGTVYADGVPPQVSPPPRQPLTDEQMRECSQAMDAEPLAEGWTELVKFARAIEAAHGIKEKNT